MRILVESLKRLYNSNKISKEAVRDRVVSEKITEDEYEYITGEEYSEKVNEEISDTVDEKIIEEVTYESSINNDTIEETINPNESEVLSENETE